MGIPETPSSTHLRPANRDTERRIFPSLIQKKVTALAFELIRDRAHTFPVIRAMSEIAGSTSIFIAAEYLSDPEYGRGTMFGGLPGSVLRRW
jgi:alanine dehydrogenase